MILLFFLMELSEFTAPKSGFIRYYNMKYGNILTFLTINELSLTILFLEI
jgi:hypothetical protein